MDSSPFFEGWLTRMLPQKARLSNKNLQYPQSLQSQPDYRGISNLSQDCGKLGTGIERKKGGHSRKPPTKKSSQKYPPSHKQRCSALLHHPELPAEQVSFVWAVKSARNPSPEQLQRLQALEDAVRDSRRDEALEILAEAGIDDDVVSSFILSNIQIPQHPRPG